MILRGAGEAGGADSIPSPAVEHEDWGEAVQAGIAEIHEGLSAAVPPAEVQADSSEDEIVERLLAEAEQAALEMVGLGDERYDTSLDDTQRGAAPGHETIAIPRAVVPGPDDETISLAAPAREQAAIAVEEEIAEEAERTGGAAGDASETAPAIELEPAKPTAAPSAVEDVPESETGQTAASGEFAAEQIVPEVAPPSGEFVASSAKKTSKYHRATCNSVRNLPDDARIWFATRADAEAAGLQACKLCRKK